MPENWSLILNVLLLIGVIVAIGRLMNARKQNLNMTRYQPVAKPQAAVPLQDDIIAVRKVNPESTEERADDLPSLVTKTTPKLITDTIEAVSLSVKQQEQPALPATVMMFLLAKENRQFAGYELLQTILASGLRFGDGQLFHRHQQANGQGPVVCSLAAATASGVFDLQNIGAFSVRGLCLFMNTSSDAQVNAEHFALMLDTAKQLSEGLDAHLLDDQRKPLSNLKIARYYRMLHIAQPEYASA